MEKWNVDRVKRLAAILAVSGALMVPLSSHAQAPGAPPIGQTPLFANQRVSAIKLSFPPGARETTHTHPFDIMVIQLTPGDAELMANGKTIKGRQEPGAITYIPAQDPHYAVNIGKEPFDVAIVALR